MKTRAERTLLGAIDADGPALHKDMNEFFEALDCRSEKIWEDAWAHVCIWSTTSRWPRSSIRIDSPLMSMIGGNA